VHGGEHQQEHSELDHKITDRKAGVHIDQRDQRQ
jgi:hypothetical protein